MSQTETPVASRMERKKEETRQKIVTVALDLFKKQGLDATTMEQIAEEVDIAKGTLYNYFPVKEAILNEFIKRSFQERNAEWIRKARELPDTRSRMIMVLGNLMGGIQAQPVIFEKYFVYRIQSMISLHQDESAESGLRSLEEVVVELGQRSGEIRTDLPVAILIGLFEFAFIEVAQQFYRAPEDFDAVVAIEQCVDLYLNGARKE